MKKKGLLRLLSVLVLLVVAIVLFALWEGYIKSSSDELLSIVEEAGKYGLQEQWEQARASLDRFDAKWKEMRDLWQAFIDHGEIDNISFSFARARALADIENLDNYAPEIYALEEMLRHIPRRQMLTSGNLF